MVGDTLTRSILSLNFSVPLLYQKSPNKKKTLLHASFKCSLQSDRAQLFFLVVVVEERNFKKSSFFLFCMGCWGQDVHKTK